MSLIYHWVIFIALALCLLLELINLWYLLRTRRRFPPPPQGILVSVLIPVRNEERYIARCLRGMINQTYRNLEILVLDDGSTDRTAEIVTSFAQEDPRIRLLMGHCLHDNWDAAVSIARDHENVYLDLTAVNDERTGVIEKLVHGAGSRKVVLGTDFPWFNHHYYIG